MAVMDNVCFSLVCMPGCYVKLHIYLNIQSDVDMWATYVYILVDV